MAATQEYASAADNENTTGFCDRYRIHFHAGLEFDAARTPKDNSDEAWQLSAAGLNTNGNNYGSGKRHKRPEFEKGSQPFRRLYGSLGYCKSDNRRALAREAAVMSSTRSKELANHIVKQLCLTVYFRSSHTANEQTVSRDSVPHNG
ncbi:hypothetical protein [Rubripirellula reticaptiva]|uniref:hypothetical protein n=1 Tax=Rubripirellula reticaptiva TaxID=2528013 RepID=UPI001C97CD22|nr:hypothetical protein [Rubripirellula reticaptiva]